MRDKNGQTPLDSARMAIVQALKEAHDDIAHHRPTHGYQRDWTDAYRREVQRHIAKQHNKMLDSFKLDGKDIETN